MCFGGDDYGIGVSDGVWVNERVKVRVGVSVITGVGQRVMVTVGVIGVAVGCRVMVAVGVIGVAGGCFVMVGIGVSEGMIVPGSGVLVGVILGGCVLEGVNDGVRVEVGAVVSEGDGVHVFVGVRVGVGGGGFPITSKKST